MADSHETPNMYPNLSATPLSTGPLNITLSANFLNDEKYFRLIKNNEIKDHFPAEIKEGDLMSKRISKCIDSFTCFDKSLIVLSATTGSISLVSFATATEALKHLHFQFIEQLQKNLLKTRKNKKKKHRKIVMLV